MCINQDKFLEGVYFGIFIVSKLSSQFFITLDKYLEMNLFAFFICNKFKEVKLFDINDMKMTFLYLQFGTIKYYLIVLWCQT
jgi:hypothetical protein